MGLNRFNGIRNCSQIRCHSITIKTLLFSLVAMQNYYDFSQVTKFFDVHEHFLDYIVNQCITKNKQWSLMYKLFLGAFFELFFDKKIGASRKNLPQYITLKFTGFYLMTLNISVPTLTR